MNPRKLALIIAGVFISANAWAANVNIAVKGMVCGFCAQGIEKKFSKEPSVEKVVVSLSDKLVTLTLRSGQNITDDKIKALLAASGYNVEKIERN